MNKKYFDYFLILFGSISFLYFILLLLNMSFTSFLLIYPFISIIVWGYAFIELKWKCSILKRLRKPIRYSLITFITCGLLFFVGVECILISKGFEDYDKKSDYIVILGAQVNGSSISASLKYRLDASLVLHELHPSSTILVSGGKGPGEDDSEAYFMKEYLMEHNVPEDKIIMEDKSKNTNQNLSFTKKILDEKSKDYTITIVTNAFHTYRAQMIADNLELDAHTYAAPMHKISIPNFYIREFFGICKDWILSL